MNKIDFDELKIEIIQLVTETVDAGNRLEGGFTRAIDEYWLSPEELDGPGKTKNYLSKLLCLTAVCSYRNSLSLPVREELVESAHLLSNLVSEPEFSRLDPEVREEVNEAMAGLLNKDFNSIFGTKGPRN